MTNDVKTVTILKKDGSYATVPVDQLPDGSELGDEIDALNEAIGIKVNGKVIKKET